MKERSESEERETIYPPFFPPPKKNQITSVFRHHCLAFHKHLFLNEKERNRGRC